MNSQVSTSRKFFRKLLGFFLQGLLLVAPISITLYVIWRVLLFIDGIIPLKIPGLGLVLVLTFITLAGAVGSLLLRTRLSKLVNRLLDRVPLIRILYSSLQDLLSAFMGKKKKFTRPVLVMMNKENQVMKMGFLTEEDLSALGLGAGMVAVYMPHSYNFSGELFLVPADQVTPLDVPSTEAMKFIVSGGVTRV